MSVTEQRGDRPSSRPSRTARVIAFGPTGPQRAECCFAAWIAERYRRAAKRLRSDGAALGGELA